jgi:hypothetical protein
MPKITKSYCDICGEETDGCTELDISTGTASKKTVEHTVNISLKVSRQGPVNSVSNPTGQMDDDECCITCYCKIIQDHIMTLPPTMSNKIRAAEDLILSGTAFTTTSPNRLAGH